MKSKFKVLVAALAGAFAWSANAALVVATNDALTVTTPTTMTGPTNIYYTGLSGGSISADLTLKKQTFLRVIGDEVGKNTTYLDIGPMSGSGVVTVSNDVNSGLFTSYRGSSGEGGKYTRSYVTVRLGENGGLGRFIFSGKVSPAGYTGFACSGMYGAWFEKVEVSANATSDNDTLDIVQVNTDGAFNFCQVVNKNTKPVRFLYNGGVREFWWVNVPDSVNLLFNPSAGQTEIHESMNGQPITFYARAASLTFGGGAAGGTAKLIGKNLRIGSDQTFRDKNNCYWDLRNEKNGKCTIDWSGLTGDIILYDRCSLVLNAADQLPYGRGHGIVRIESNGVSGNEYAGSMIRSNGQVVHLNGLVRGGTMPQYSCVSNISTTTTGSTIPVTAVMNTTPATLIFGADNMDGMLNITLSPYVNVVKEGTGELTVENTLFDVNASFIVSNGTVVISGDANQLPTNFVVEEGAKIIYETAFDVPSGTTKTVDDLIVDGADAPRRVRKTGAGTLVLGNGANSFTGGLVVDAGIVQVATSGAQGAGKIIVKSTASSNGQVDFKFTTTGGTVANDIEVTGDNNPLLSDGSASISRAAVVFSTVDIVMEGTITSDGDLYVRDGFGDNVASKAHLGPITAAPGHTLFMSAGGELYADGKITADVLHLPRGGGYRRSLYLNHANAIGRIKLDPKSDNLKLYVKSSNGAVGTAVEFVNVNNPGNYRQSNIRGTFEMQVNTSIASLEGPDHLRDVDNSFTNVGYTVGCNAGNAVTMTMTGRTDVDSAKFCGGIGNANLTIALEAREGFTQVFSNVLCNSTKELRVSGGTLVLDGKTYFTALTKITVEGTGVLDIRGLGAVSGDSKGFSTLTNISIASTAKIKLAEGIELKAAAVMVDGFQLNADTYSTGYSAATLPWIEGAGTIKATSSPTPPVTARDAVWSGAGGDSSTTTAANWRDTPPPAFYYLGYRPVFGEGGSEAVFPAGTSLLNGIAFNRAGDFTMRGVEDAKLKLYSGITADNAADADTLYTYDIAAPVESAAASLAFAVPTNRTLRTSGGIAPAEDVAKTDLAKTGLGTLELVDARVAGDLTANTADCGVLKLSGDIGVEGDSGKLIYRNYNYTQVPGTSPAKWYATYCGYLHLDNAIVHKPFNFQSGGSVTCTNGNNSTTWLTCAAGSTNIFKEPVIHAGSSTWLLDSDATIIFEKGYSDPASGGGGFNVGMKTGCRNGTFIFRGPVKMVYTAKGTMGFATASGAKVIFESTGNICTNYYAFAYLNTIFKVDDAFTSTKYFVVDNGGTADTIVDLTTTRQSIPMFWIKSNKGLVKGDYPSEVAITQGLPDESAATTTNFYPIAINGWVKISKSGSGYQKIGSTAAVAYGSYGDLEVSGGTLELMSGTTWLNGTNFIARGDGQLKLTATNKSQIGSQAVFHFAENGTVEIPSGVTVSVSAAFVEGAQVGAGTYSAATAEGPMAGRVTGGGKLRVRSGMMLILR